MKIKRLEIENFRGITNCCKLDFTDKEGKALSAIIYGDNGTGKSSIIDAIEYNLQCKLGRYIIYENQYCPTILNYSNLEGEVKTRITFDNDETFERSFGKMKDGLYHSSSDDMNECFDKVSFLIRRNDINSFTTTDSSHRQIFLSQFVYDNKGIFNRLVSDPETKYLRELTEHNISDKEQIIEQLAELTQTKTDTLRQYSMFLEQTFNAMFVPKGEEKYSRIPIDKEKYKQIKELSAKLKDLELEILFSKEYDKRLQYGPGDDFNQVMMPYFEEAQKYVNESFKKVSDIEFIKKIVFSSDQTEPCSFHIFLELENGEYVEGHKVLSEANYDMLVLLLYISIIRSGVKKGQCKLLVLDDVLQSVDSKLRSRFISFILKEMKDWQVIVTCHDRLWLTQLKYLFNTEGHKYCEYHIHNWNFREGVMMEKIKPITYDNSLEKAVETKDIRIIASMAGLFLEMICQYLSVSLQIPVTRRVEDKYTIGDLWPGVKKILSKTDLRELVETIENKKIVRNIVGCHYNEWADTISDREIVEFAELVQDLYKNTFCRECGQWISKVEAGKIIAECKCRSLQYVKP